MQLKKIIQSVLVISALFTGLVSCTGITTKTKDVPQSNVAIVETKSGKLQGTINDNIFTYLGVPYAEAREHFVPAKEVKPWDGIRKADTYGAMSPQGAILGMPVNGDETGKDNNSQNLNIWTPGIADGKKRPVMVWLHGGGFSVGTANNAVTNGKNLSQSGDVVVVSVNHRLNIFGHLDLSAYGEKYKYSSNVGIMDIVAALKWIQNNIKEFGGDPNNVTVFGESGGGAKVLALMTSPYAKGLFHKGVIESGATETMGVTFSTKEQSKVLTENILKNLGITSDNIDKLQNISNRELQEASSKALKETANIYKIPAAFTSDYAMEWGPVIDGDYMPSNPVKENGFADAGKNIPLLIGSNLNEWTIWVPSSAQKNMTEAQRNAFSKAYPDKNKAKAENVDTFIRLPMLKIMSHKVDQGGAPVYSYVFTWEDSTRGSYHGAEIPFVFNNVDNNSTPETKELAKTISQAWVNFARTGTPSAESLPKWEAYDREKGATMILDNKSELRHNHDKELIQLLAPNYKY